MEQNPTRLKVELSLIISHYKNQPVTKVTEMNSAHALTLYVFRIYLNIVTGLLKALLDNSSVNTFQHATMGAVFSVGECYSSLLSSTTILATDGGVFYVIRATQQYKCFLCGPRCVYIMGVCL
jgi:hypothetical protein